MDLNETKADHIADARGSACPGPILEAKKGIGKVPMNGILEVLSNDPKTKKDLPMWANKVGHEYLGTVEVDGYDKLFLRRKK